MWKPCQIQSYTHPWKWQCTSQSPSATPLHETLVLSSDLCPCLGGQTWEKPGRWLLEASVKGSRQCPLKGQAMPWTARLACKARSGGTEEMRLGSLPWLSHVLLSVPLTPTGDFSSVKEDGQDDSHFKMCGQGFHRKRPPYSHPSPGGTDPDGERHPKPQAPPCRLGRVLQKGCMILFRGIQILRYSNLLPTDPSCWTWAQGPLHFKGAFLDSPGNWPPWPPPLFQTCLFPRTNFKNVSQKTGLKRNKPSKFKWQVRHEGWQFWGKEE